MTTEVKTVTGSGADDLKDAPDPNDVAFRSPKGITRSGSELYVADYGNHRIRKVVISTGETETYVASNAGVEDSIGYLIGELVCGPKMKLGRNGG